MSPLVKQVMKKVLKQQSPDQNRLQTQKVRHFSNTRVSRPRNLKKVFAIPTIENLKKSEGGISNDNKKQIYTKIEEALRQKKDQNFKKLAQSLSLPFMVKDQASNSKAKKPRV